MKIKEKIIILDLLPDVGSQIFIKSSIIFAMEQCGFEVKKIKINHYSMMETIKKIPINNLISQIINILTDLIQGFSILFIFLFSFGKTREEFLSKCLEIRYNGLLIGDCIVSEYFRNTKTKVLPQKSLDFFIFILLSIPKIGYRIRQLKIDCFKLKEKNKSFLILETTGFQEIWRRFLISQKIFELRFCNFHQGLRLFDNFKGFDIRKGEIFRKAFYSKMTKSEISSGKLILKKLVSRQTKYDYLKSIDIDPNRKINLEPLQNKSTVILFLATISDAQYVYGKGPFSDIHGFNMGVINAALDQNLNVVIKPHPGMFADKDYTVKDRTYFNSIKKDWKASEFCSGLLHSKINRRLFFSDADISSTELSRVFPGFLCATQHGTIAAECAFNGHLSIVGCNSQYFSDDTFVRIIREKSDIIEYFKEWELFSGFSKNDKISIYKYSYVNNIKCRLPYISKIFGGIIPSNLDSWQAETWLESYLDINKENGIQNLHKACRSFYSNSDNDFKTALKMYNGIKTDIT